MEAIAPTEVGVGSWRVAQYDPQSNNVVLHKQVDMVKELKKTAATHSEIYKGSVARAYNACIQPRNFQAGELMRRFDVMHPVGKFDTSGKSLIRWQESCVLGHIAYSLRWKGNSARMKCY